MRVAKLEPGIRQGRWAVNADDPAHIQLGGLIEFARSTNL